MYSTTMVPFIQVAVSTLVCVVQLGCKQSRLAFLELINLTNLMNLMKSYQYILSDRIGGKYHIQTYIRLLLVNFIFHMFFSFHIDV